MQKYGHSILGGTFDHFHTGHEALLNAAFAQSEKVTIGLTTEKFYQDKLLSVTIEDYDTRKEAVEKYLTEKNYLPQTAIMKLTDIYGPALTEPHIDAIFITDDTIGGAKKINEERGKKGFSELEVIAVPFAMASDGKPITSERIRLGEIDTTGNVYSSIFQDKTALLLPDTLRETLREPIGEVLTDTSDILQRVRHSVCTITVGDIVTLTLLQHSLRPTVSIIDLTTRRVHLEGEEKKLLSSLKSIPFTNTPGEISSDITPLFRQTITQAIKEGTPRTILVAGEEDLLTLPAILLAPLDSLVIYGQYQTGAILVKVTPERKQFVKSLLTQFIAH